MSIPFDRAHLSTFTQGDVRLEHELLSAFAHNAELLLSALNDAVATPQWAEMAHRLKGAASGVGVWQIAKLCSRAEALGKGTPEKEAYYQLLIQLKQELAVLQVYLVKQV